MYCIVNVYRQLPIVVLAVADPGGGRGGHGPPPGSVKIRHKKDGRRGRIDFMFLAPPPYPAAGSTTVLTLCEDITIIIFTHNCFWDIDGQRRNMLKRSNQRKSYQNLYIKL